jgi:rod shape determining protein RodA
MIWIAARSERDTGSYLCVGLAACLMLQVVINVGMCFAVLPVIGITLPLVSYGGSSVLATYLMFGMVHSVSAHRNRSSSIWD